MALWLGTGCKPAVHQQTPAQAQMPVKDPPPTPIAEKKAELGKPTWDPEWDRIVEEALPAEMLSPKVARAVRPFCPGFNSMSEVDKRAYWAYFFQALSGAEAGLQPTADTRHTEPEVAVRDTVTEADGATARGSVAPDLHGRRPVAGGMTDWEKDKQAW